jgi:hypothetical protein
MLVMRVGTIAGAYTQLVFKACPGRPDSGLTISTTESTKARKP